MLLFECNKCGCSFTIKEETIMNDHKNYWCQNCTSEEYLDNWLKPFESHIRASTAVIKNSLELPGVTLSGMSTLQEMHTKLQESGLTLKQITNDLTDE